MDILKNVKRELEYYKDLIIELTKKDIKVRYKNSYLGYFWSLANPLCLALIFYFIFKIVVKVKTKDFTLFLISGLFVWQWINNSLMASANVYISNSSLIKKVNFPKNFLVLSLVLSEGFNFLLSLPVIVIFLLYYNYEISWKGIFIIPLLFILTAIIIYCLSLIIAVINVFFRDLERIVSILLIIIFYLTPIVYSESMIPEKYKFIVYINPFALLVLSWRNFILYGKLNYKFIFLIILYTALLILISNFIYKKLKDKLPELV